MSKKSKLFGASDEAAPEVAAEAAPEAAPEAKEEIGSVGKILGKGKAKADPKEKVTIEIPRPVKINGKTLVGRVEVTKAQAECINEMVNKKTKSDLRIAVGRNMLVERLADRTLVIKESKS